MSYQKLRETDTSLPADVVDFLCNTNKNGEEIPIKCTENVVRAVRSMNLVRYDRFKNRYEVRVGDEWETRKDHHDISIYSQMSEQFRFLSSYSVSAVRDAITLVASEQEYDSAQEWLASLTWDQTPRLDTWLHEVFHVEDNKYHRAIGSNWLKGLAKRIMRPGCKFDYALVLHGAQGIRKSTALLTIAGEKNHAEFTELRTREFQQDIQGKLVVEFSEAAVFRKNDQETLKSIVTRQQDTYRPPYARASVDFLRRCVFAVTANNDEILKDDTGNRRWWVVLCPKKTANTTWLEENREQLFAEAYYRVQQGESVHEVPEDVLTEQHEKLRMTEENEDVFLRWWRNTTDNQRANGVTVRQAYCDVFEPRDRNGDRISPDNVSIPKRTEMAIARIFAHLKLEKNRVRTEKGQETRWFQPNALQDYNIIYPETEQKEQDTKIEDYDFF